MTKSFQDQGSVIHCYGCGSANTHGLKLKSFWDGDEAVARFTPQPYHCGGAPDIVYGGLIASLMDCHSCNFAIARTYTEEGRPIGSSPRVTCVTAQLNISLEKPTPINKELQLRAKLKSAEGRKTWVLCELSCEGQVTAKAEILVVRVKDSPL